MSTSRPPNILWVVTTQWRAQATGFAGDPNAETPWLDALAREAANFTQAVTPHPFGPFARAALLTGVPSPANQVKDYFDALPPTTRTIAHQMRDAGYRTAYFGKWHLAPRDPAAALVGEVHARMIVPPAYRGGFEFWEGFESGFLLNDPWLHGSRLPAPQQFPGYQSDVVGGRAAEWLHAAGATRAQPWFCVVSLEPPHPPYGANAAGVPPREPHALQLAPNVPRGGEAEVRARRELAGYYAHVTATDRAIGRLIESVDRADTIVVVTSVHGDLHGAHGLFRKGWPYEESIRVPLLVRVPERLAPDNWAGPHPGLVSLIDLPAWTAAWARSAAPAQAGSTVQHISMPSVVALPFQCDRVWAGVRTERRKLIVSAGPSSEGPATPWLYFDLARDPWEQNNLAADPARRDEIAGLMPLIHSGPA